MPYLAATTLVAFALALLLSRSGMPALHVHVALAVGMLPLMVGAMLYFVPVLTRSGAAGRQISQLPWLAMLAGVTVVTAFAAGAWQEVGRIAAAMLGLSAAVLLLGWMEARSRAALGSPHPSLRWYQAALGSLVLALLAIPAMSLWPEHYLALKRFHLHLNSVGLIGLTAVGTLHVLMPTAVGEPDRQAAARLRTGLPAASAGTLLIAVGAAWQAELAWLGAALWLVPLARLLVGWAGLYGDRILAWNGIPPSLAAAGAGFALSLLLGPLHGGDWVAAPGAAHAYIAVFLLPLVSGAVSQLLPLWLRPGVQNAWHDAVRASLGKRGGVRAGLFFCGGLVVALGWPAGWLAVAAGMALFLAQLPVVFTKK